MSRLTEERLNHVERAVQGSSTSLQYCFDEAAEYYNFGFTFDDLTAEEERQLCDFIDNHHFECVRCGWWCEVSEVSELHEEMVCTDCEDEE